MAPFYDHTTLLEPGTMKSIGAGPKKTAVEIMDDNHALVISPEGHEVYVGRARLKDKGKLGQRWIFDGDPRVAVGRTILCKESVSASQEDPRLLGVKKDCNSYH